MRRLLQVGVVLLGCLVVVAGGCGDEKDPVKPVSGACCLPDGSCLVLTETDCDARDGGTWQGGGTGCDPSPCQPANTSPTACFSVEPLSGTTDTLFAVDASCSTDEQDSTAVLQVRWDWENDGEWDTEWTTTKTASHQYSTTGTKTIRLQVKDTGGLMDVATRSVTVSEDPTHLPGFVAVPAGVFTMGDGVTYCGTDQRQVTLTRSFYLGQHEVTNQQYLEAVQWAYDHGYVTATTAWVRDNLNGSTQVLLRLDNEWSEIQFDGAGSFYLRESPWWVAQNAYPDGYDPADHPVKMVTWHGAVNYCDLLSLQEGMPRAYEHTGNWACNGGDPYGAQGYRLPTDAEWEYAARWNDGRIYPWGNEAPDCSRANYNCRGCVGWTSPVGSYPDAPAALGLSDMAGNVWEWCSDWWVCNLGTTAVTDPTGPGSGSHRVLRGGSWDNGGGNLRCAYRGNINPNTSHYVIGFRAARTITP